MTPAGAELLPRAQAMLQNLNESYEALRARGREREVRLAVGCLPTIATFYLPSLLKEFSSLQPDITVRVHDNSAAEIAGLVERGEAEFGVTVLSASRWDLEMKPLMKERYVLLCPADHLLAARGEVDWSDFEGEPLVRISPQTANRAIIDEALGSRREFMTWRYEVQHIATAVRLVIATLTASCGAHGRAAARSQGRDHARPRRPSDPQPVDQPHARADLAARLSALSPRPASARYCRAQAPSAAAGQHMNLIHWSTNYCHLNS